MNRNKIGKIILSLICSLASLWVACDATVNAEISTFGMFWFFLTWSAVCGFVTWLCIELVDI